MNLHLLTPPEIATATLSVMEHLFDDVPDAVFFIKDRSGRYLAVSQSLVTRCGLDTKKDLLGRQVHEVFPPHLAKRFAAQDESVLRAGRHIVNRLELVWHPRQRIGWCLTTKLPLRNAAGEIIGMAGYSRDVHTAGDRDHIPTRLLETFDYLESHFDGPLAPSDLAAKAGLSLVRFARLTKRLLGLTPGQLITQARLSEATRLLRDTERSISDIATRCGFCDHSAFTRAFHAATSMTPSEFRRT